MEAAFFNNPSIQFLVNIALNESQISKTKNSLVYYDKDNNLIILDFNWFAESEFKKFQSNAKLKTTNYNCVFVHRNRISPPSIVIGYDKCEKYITKFILPRMKGK